jgi:AP-2 complex subunit beta-1
MAMFFAYAFDSARLHTLRTQQGKVAELRLELNSGGKKDKNFSAKKTALKKIVANMTMSNNDMVALFPDIVGCMHIQSLEIKKMWVTETRLGKVRG